MFSEEFAKNVITESGIGPDAMVLDPWLGAGTSTAVAAFAGCRSAGLDVNPVMVAVSRGRTLDQASAKKCVRAVRAKVAHMAKRLATPEDPLLEWFRPQAANALRRWECAARSVYSGAHSPEELGFFLTCLFEAASELAAPYRSRNPTWVKKPDAKSRLNATPARIWELVLAAANRRIGRCPPTPARHRPSIQLGTSIGLSLPDDFADLVLTSPPYCTRIDYAISTAVEAAVLGLDPPAAEALRNGTMGTSTIRGGTLGVKSEWGRTCQALLATVADHPSKASRSYYYKNFLQYFDDLGRSVVEIDRCVRPGGQIVIVVQDSVYKGERVDLATIVAEMARPLGWQEVSRAGFPVPNNMRRVNTRSRLYLPDVASIETVLWFLKPAAQGKTR
jgi:SAM-dependent methyltransferase